MRLAQLDVMANKNWVAPAAKIIWAVDPFAKDKTLQRNAVWGLRALTRAGKHVIEPVYSVATGHSTAEQVRLIAQQGLDELLSRVKLPGLLPIRVLAVGTGSVGAGAEALINHARKTGAGMIFASTRARKGPSRWVTGSFAESLMLRSDLPLMLVNPWWDRSHDLKQILFPTDFSAESKKAFGQVVELARTIRGKVTVFHKIRFDLNPLLGSVMPVLREDVQSAREKALSWAHEAELSGVNATAFVDGRPSGSAAGAILRFSKKMPGLIAMAGHSGPISSVLLGSTARQVMRASSVPVWIVQSRAAKKQIKSAKRVSYVLNEDEVVSDLQHHGRADA